MAATKRAIVVKEYWLSREGLEKIRLWREQGMTEEQISKCAKIDYSTLRRWKKDSEELRTVLEEGVCLATDKVVNALYQAATKDRNIQAIKMWLFSKERGKWTDKPDDEVVTNDSQPVIINLHPTNPIDQERLKRIDEEILK